MSSDSAKKQAAATARERTFVEGVETIQKALHANPDANNKEAFAIAKTQGMHACVAHMTQGRDYATMRVLYG